MLADATPDNTPTPRPKPVPGRARFQSFAALLNPRVLFMAVIALVSILPAGYVLSRAVEASANVVYWDEFDTALSLVLRLQDGMTPSAFFGELFAMNNEHRMVTSRLLFALSYAVTGSVNFSFISLMGNASIVALVVLLIATAGSAVRALRMGALLGFLMFQLEHYENFLWSGSSIDHFQVVLLAGAAVVGVAQGTRAGALWGGLFAMLATFTLAHGILAWLVGSLMLAERRRWTDLIGWIGLAGLTMLGFLNGFAHNESHRFAEISLGGTIDIATYWLTLLGAVPALGNTCVAPALGLVLVATLTWLGTRGALHREPIAFALALFAVIALGLIAVGRAAESDGVIFSRYMVLGATAWAMMGFIILEFFTPAARPFKTLSWVMVVLIGFNLAANHAYEAQAESWMECRDLAVLHFKKHGVDGRGPFSLHPVPTHSTALLAEAEARGVYRLAPICITRSFPEARPTSEIVYFVDEITVDSRSAFVEGWAAIPGKASKRRSIHLVLKSETETHVYTTVTSRRPDVATVLKQPSADLCGFSFALRRDRLPTGNFQLGILIEDDGNAEYIMTAHRLELIGEGKGLLATGD
jgi:hypothetical protein